ncbi:MFS transporter [Arthrobacter sp. FW306-04-A]|uniref:MFS transporter n=1 Tax=Arthrobacter sp. FW306-04-A TaxID=2879619 RepID=UPI0037C14483|nr:MHS family MFS transporter [Arthrobacter sp. FW306-04-A]
MSDHLGVDQLSSSETTATPKARQGRGRVLFASFIGTVIEFYDFGIYGTAAALVFPQVFFPALGPAAGTVASFATFGVAFAARPLGSIIFGHFGDILGRKRSLVATMLMMGISTFLVGLLPTASQIGVVAPLLLTALRIFQGIAAGGEYAGAVLFVSEHSPKASRGLWSAAPNLGGSGAIILTNLTFLLTSLTMSPQAFVAWGWRIPFLTSAVLVLLGLWVRLRVSETPVFISQQARGTRSRAPFLEAFRVQSRQIFLAIGSMICLMALVYVGGPYLTSYGSKTLGMDQTFVLAIATVGGLMTGVGILIGSAWSDRIGRRKVMIVGAAAGTVWTLALFPILDMKTGWAFAIGMPLTSLISGVVTGPVGAFLSELFHTRYRYTAAGISYSVAAMIGGALPPIIAPIVIERWGSLAFGFLLAFVCLLSLLCIVALKETRNYELDRVDTDVKN